MGSGLVVMMVVFSTLGALSSSLLIWRLSTPAMHAQVYFNIHFMKTHTCTYGRPHVRLSAHDFEYMCVCFCGWVGNPSQYYMCY